MPDSGGGYAIPGDPDAIRSAAGQLTAVSQTLGTAQSSTTSSVSSVDGVWTGEAASAFTGSAHLAATGFTTLAAAAANAAHALTTYAGVLQTAQQTAATANSLVSQASVTYRTAMANLPDGHAAASAAQTQAENSLSSASTRAAHLMSSAENEVKVAAGVAAAALQGASAHADGSSFHELADQLGGPGTALALVGLVAQGWTWSKLYTVFSAVRSGDFAKLAKADPKGWADVEKVADEFGEGDMRSLVAQLKYEGSSIDGALEKAADAAVPDGAIPASGLDGALDVLGKVGFGLAVVGDVDTLFFNKDATNLDKGMAAGNVAGIALVEGGEGAATLLGLDAAAGAVPVVGEVVIAGTAIYFAAEWTHAHWDEVKRWAGDAAHGVENAASWSAHEVTALNNWANQQIDHGATTLLHVGEHLGSDIVSAGSTVTHTLANAGSTALHGVEDVGNDAVGTLESGTKSVGHVLSDLNPF